MLIKRFYKGVVNPLIMIALLVVFCRCSDDNTDNDAISDLLSDNLTVLNSDIPEGYYDDLTFIDENTGYAVSRSGSIIKTINGGSKWTTLDSKVTFPLKKIQFVSPEIGFVIGNDETQGYFLKTMDAGQTWTSVQLGSIVNSLFFKNANEGFIAGDHLFIKTADGGQTWANVLEIANYNFQDVAFSNNLSIAYLTTYTNAYYKSTDKGLTWQLIHSSIDNKFRQIYLINNNVYFLGNGQLTDINSNMSVTLPNAAHKFLYLDANKCIGIGQHYETGFFPYGDILLSNENWKSSQQKTYQPSSEAADFTALSPMRKHKTMILGTGQVETLIITIEY